MVDKLGSYLILKFMTTPRTPSRSATSPPAPRRTGTARSARPEPNVATRKFTGQSKTKPVRKSLVKPASKRGINKRTARVVSVDLERAATPYLFGSDTVEEAIAKARSLISRKRISKPGLGEAADRFDKMAQILRTLARQPAREPRPRSAAKTAATGRKMVDIVAAARKAAEDGPKNLIEQGAFIPAIQLCERLDISRQALSKAKSDKRMFAIIGPSGDAYYPAFFADDRHDRRQLEKVSRALQDLPATSKYFFFTAPRQSLGGKSPLDAIANGQIDAVLRSASGFAER